MEQFKKNYPNSVCFVENKGLGGEKTFYTNSLGKN